MTSNSNKWSILLDNQQSVNQVIMAPPMQWVYVLILGVFSSAIAYVAWTKALSVAEKTSQVSNNMFLTPFLTSVLGFLIAGEIPE
ncbi:DMT family transporter [Acetobacterium tundrae]|uniref:DMT family transporter n=1 Tax=Acetobacterium tundrae TaxID=132932 RepID=UPI001A9A83A3|nr:DMT family transporter [Acetobacterium tundrae]